MSNRPSISLSFLPPTCLPLHLYVYLSIFVYLYVGMSVYVCLSKCVIKYMPVLFIYLYVRVFVYLFTMSNPSSINL